MSGKCMVSIAVLTVIGAFMSMGAASRQSAQDGGAPEYNQMTIVVDASSPGREFEGLGTISAGAATRLLIDYPEPQRSQILDLLFKPACGAAIQHLKTELPGDMNSTDGTEPSYARTREEFENPKVEYFNRGYEVWLMREARKRNPDIKLDILQWGAPGWIGDRPEPLRKRSKLSQEGIQWFFKDIKMKPAFQEKDFASRWYRFYSRDNVDFIVNYIIGLKKHFGLSIDYCGIWNEVQYDASWIKMLRRGLDAKGLKNVRIIAADQCFERRWDISKEMLEDPELMDAIYGIGAHYPGYRRPSTMPTESALATGKPLSASEECSYPGTSWNGALYYARTFNINYIEGRMTRSLVWNTIVSYYDNLPAGGRGPMRANQPWSGHYDISPGLWAFAHTTQFTKPGWRYLDSACGEHDGTTYVTMVNPDDPGQFSVIIETSRAKKSIALQLEATGRINAKKLHVWKSCANAYFEQQQDIIPVNGKFRLELSPRCIYSITTTSGQGKASFTPPPPGRFPFPYSEDFEGCSINAMPRYFTDIGGVFEVVERPDGGGKCLYQVINRRPIDWFWVAPGVFTVLGDRQWRDYSVSCDACSQGAGEVVLYGRVGTIRLAKNVDSPRYNAYSLHLDDSGYWKLMAVKREIAAGHISKRPATGWWHLELQFTGDRIIAGINGVQVADVKDSAYKRGMAGVGCGWNSAWFDNLKITRPQP